MGFLDIFKSRDKDSSRSDNGGYLLPDEVSRTSGDNLPVEVCRTPGDDLPVRFTSDESNMLTKLRTIGEIGSKLGDIYIESKRINSNIKALRIQTSKEVKEHAMTISFHRELVTKVFSERAIGLRKHYEVLDKALKNDDRELIIISLQGISSIIVANPIEQMAQYAQMLQSKDTKLMLDF